MGVTTLCFKGVVRYESGNPDRVLIDDRVDLLAEISWVRSGAEGVAVLVTRGSEKMLAEGRLDVDPGSEHFSTWTPGENPRFYVGDVDILRYLQTFDGEQVIVDVAIPAQEGKS